MVSHFIKVPSGAATKIIEQSLMNYEINYRMAKAAKRLNAILDYMKKVKSSISMVFGLVF